MKRNYLLVILIFINSLFTLSHGAKEPKWLKKVRMAQVTVLAYDEKDEMHQTQGMFIDGRGTVITEYDALKGARKIVVVDTNGKEHPVTSIAGANSMYNLSKFNVQLDDKDKIAFAEQSSTDANEQDIVYILPGVQADKSNAAVQDTIIKAEKFKETYNYYTLANMVNERQANSPVFNEAGQLVGLIQLPSGEGKNAFVIDSKFATDMQITAMDAANADLKAIKVHKQLPSKQEDAASFIFLVGTRDTTQYLEYVDEYIRNFPGSTTGYTMKAEMLLSKKDYAAAKEVYTQALAIDSIKQDEIHFSLAKKVYELNLTPGYEVYEDWTMEKSLSEAEEAYKLNPLPAYMQTQAGSLYALKRYQEAYDKYMALTKTNLRTPEIFLYAAQCKQMSKAPTEEILALQDSAIASFGKPYPQVAANYFLMRGNTRAQLDKYRDAVADFNEYEKIMGFNVTANFYYEREQLEVKCRMFAAALNDIERAIKLAPKEPVFWAESAALNYRVGQIEDAIAVAQEAIKVDDKFPDIYRILGVCYNQQGKTTEAKKYLQKAIELGDTIAQGILDKMK